MQKNIVLEAILSELERERGFIDTKVLSTIYFGGGTPSVYSPEQIESVIDKIRTLWDCSAVEEITMEANPDDLTPDYLRQLALTDVNRLSIGIQSFCDDDLRFMNRRHTAEAAIRAVGDAQTAGFHNITIDLIYGVPGMSLRGWEKNIDIAIGLEVQHISAYHLSIEEKTVFGRMASRGEIKAVDEAVSQQHYMLLHKRLEEAGFEHYEISNFARAGFRAKHNSAYWSGEPYLGVGPSAHSFNGSVRRWSSPSIRQYMEAQPSDIYQSETISPTDAYNEFVMTALRRAEGVSLARLESRFGACKLQYFLKSAATSLAEGTLIRNREWVYIPFQHFLIADTIICELFESF